MPPKNSDKPPGGSVKKTGGRRRRLPRDWVEMTTRAPLEFRNAVKVWAIDRDITMSEVVVEDLKPPGYKPK